MIGAPIESGTLRMLQAVRRRLHAVRQHLRTDDLTSADLMNEAIDFVDDAIVEEIRATNSAMPPAST